MSEGEPKFKNEMRATGLSIDFFNEINTVEMLLSNIGAANMPAEDAMQILRSLAAKKNGNLCRAYREHFISAGNEVPLNESDPEQVQRVAAIDADCADINDLFNTINPKQSAASQLKLLQPALKNVERIKKLIEGK